MAQRNVNVRAGRIDIPPDEWPLGKAFIYQSAIWRIKGFYLSATPSGGREVWWILGAHQIDGTEFTGGAGP